MLIKSLKVGVNAYLNRAYQSDIRCFSAAVSNDDMDTYPHLDQFDNLDGSDLRAAIKRDEASEKPKRRHRTTRKGPESSQVIPCQTLR